MAKELKLKMFLDLCTEELAKEYSEIKIDLSTSNIKVYGTKKPEVELLVQHGYGFGNSGIKKL